MTPFSARIKGTLRVFALGAAMALATSCSEGPTGPLRDTTAPISSQADATAAKLAGDWVVRYAWFNGVPALIQGYGVFDFNAARLHIARRGAGLSMSGWVVRDASTDEVVLGEFTARLEPSGLGRFHEKGTTEFAGAELWVLWLDAGNRTVAFGTPGGEFGWILDRRRSGGEDRIREAKETMKRMGYDMARVSE